MKVVQTICLTSSLTCDLRRVIRFHVILLASIRFGVYPIWRSIHCFLRRKSYRRHFPDV